MAKTHSLINYMALARDILTRSPEANAITMTHSLTRSSADQNALTHTDGFEALCQSVRLHSTRQNDSNSDSKPISSFDFDHINTMWESDDWDELHAFTRSPSAPHSLVTRFHATRSLAHKRVGGIHFLTIGRWRIQFSRVKAMTRVKVDMEERLLRLLLPLVIWPALCITVIQLCEAIGFGGR
jgi:hypothetical protein